MGDVCSFFVTVGFDWDTVCKCPALIIWQVKKDEMAFVSVNAKECLNFQISVSIYALLCVVGVLFYRLFLLIFGDFRLCHDDYCRSEGE